MKESKVGGITSLDLKLAIYTNQDSMVLAEIQTQINRTELRTTEINPLEYIQFMFSRNYFTLIN